MNGAVVLLIVLAIPYLALNLRRVYSGRPWALTVCQVAKEWEQREHAKRLARRAAQLGRSARPVRRLGLRPVRVPDAMTGAGCVQSRVVRESIATVIARRSGASSPAATSTP